MDEETKSKLLCLLLFGMGYAVGMIIKYIREKGASVGMSKLENKALGIGSLGIGIYLMYWGIKEWEDPELLQAGKHFLNYLSRHIPWAEVCFFVLVWLFWVYMILKIWESLSSIYHFLKRSCVIIYKAIAHKGESKNEKCRERKAGFGDAGVTYPDLDSCQSRGS